MDKLLRLLKLEDLKGSRTKIVILIDVALYALVQFGYMDKGTVDSLQPILLSMAAFFGVEHFEKGDTK